MDVVVSLDIGTTSLCAMAFSADEGRVIGIASAPNDADVSPLPAGRHEQDAALIVERCFGLLKQLLAEPRVPATDVVGIGVTGQMHGVLLVDERRQPLTNLVTWRDMRALETGPLGHLPTALARLGDGVRERTGAMLSPGYGGATLLWLAENGFIPSGARALTIADYLVAMLSGVAASEPTHAASWGIWNVAHSQWDGETVAGLSIPDTVLPDVKSSVRPVGVVLDDVARDLGLPATALVCSPVGDNQASFIGAAGFDTDLAVINLGTGGQVSVATGDYAFVPGLETRPLPFGGYILVGASLCGGWSYAHLCRFFREIARELAGVDVPERRAYERLNALAARTPEGADGLVADTRFSGTRTDPHVRGAFTGIGRNNLTPGHLSRAVIEGVVRELVELGGAAGIDRVSRIVATGNAVRMNPLVAETIARLSGLPCRVSDTEEEACLGAAYCAAVGLGVVSADDVLGGKRA